MNIKRNLLSVLIAGVCITTIANAENDYYYKGDKTAYGSKKKDKNTIGIYIPKPTKVEPIAVTRARSELTTRERGAEYSDIRKRMIDRYKILKGVKDIPISRSVKRVIMKDIIHITMTNAYTKTIRFGGGFKITSIINNYAKEVPYTQNQMVIYPPKLPEQLIGDITVFLTDGKKNYSLTLIIDPFLPVDCSNVAEGNTTKYEECRAERKAKDSLNNTDYFYNQYYPIVEVAPRVALDVIEVLNLYMKEKKLVDLGLENNQTKNIIFRGVHYIIKRDDSVLDNFVSIKGKKYTIKTI